MAWKSDSGALRTASSGASLGRVRGARAARGLAGLALAVCLATASAGPVRADDYDPQEAGHPVRIIAYVLHPVGVVLDYLIFRPAHWLVSHEPLQTLFGHEEEDE